MAIKSIDSCFDELSRETGLPTETFVDLLMRLKVRDHLDATSWVSRYLYDTVKRKGKTSFEYLHRVGLTTSETFGRAVFALVQHGHVEAEESDDISDFEGLYSIDTLKRVVKKMKLRANVFSTLRYIGYGLFALALVTLFLASVHVVSADYGWLSWIVIGFLSLLSRLKDSIERAPVSLPIGASR